MINYDLLLIVHVICGGISLLLGLGVMIQRKGGRLHRRVGTTYYYTMLLAAFSALPMSYIRNNYFLFTLAVLTLYMVITGRRYIRKRKNQKPTPFDWLMTFIIVLAGLSFMSFGIYKFSQNSLFGIVYVSFGFAALFFAWQDIRNFLNKSPIGNYWLTTHLQRMIGSYIASVTAFLVVNNNIIPGIVAWLLPSVILVPLIVKWTWRYRMNKMYRNPDPDVQYRKFSNT
ncbi:DUF2306 domain-containing protein [Pollutibacter soli]|uniref:DUF2306 domain-containing protein n=1 Tax=Pollutibacter soli TaxID=3034157 RepID=UPI00301388F4